MFQKRVLVETHRKFKTGKHLYTNWKEKIQIMIYVYKMIFLLVQCVDSCARSIMNATFYFHIYFFSGLGKLRRSSNILTMTTLVPNHARHASQSQV